MRRRIHAGLIMTSFNVALIQPTSNWHARRRALMLKNNFHFNEHINVLQPGPTLSLNGLMAMRDIDAMSECAFVPISGIPLNNVPFAAKMSATIFKESRRSYFLGERTFKA